MIPAIVLAAGESSRMGRPKALLPLGLEETFLTRIVRTFREAGVEDVVVVLGHEADAIARTLDGGAARIVVNERYRDGQLTSLVAGLRIVDRPGVVAALVTLVDAPLVTAATVRAVVDRYRRTGARVARPVRGAEHGHPVLIDRSLFGALRAGNPAVGARAIVRAHATAEGDVEVTDEGAFTDIDTPEEYQRVLQELSEQPPGR